MGEKVLVFSERLMKGFSELIENKISQNKSEINYFMANCLDDSYFERREEAEKNESYKQIIPYVLVKHDNKYLVYQRTSKSGEDRLHQKLSIGIGGHINSVDKSEDPGDTLHLALIRELQEELSLNLNDIQELDINIKGLIYDNSDSVGRVHFGFLVEIELDSSAPRPKENEAAIANIRWMNKEELTELNNLESWSELAIKVI